MLYFRNLHASRKRLTGKYLPVVKARAQLKITPAMPKK
jgi:hypothetical protein